jgi:hypothetical protein
VGRCSSEHEARKIIGSHKATRIIFFMDIGCAESRYDLQVANVCFGSKAASQQFSSPAAAFGQERTSLKLNITQKSSLAGRFGSLADLFSHCSPMSALERKAVIRVIGIAGISGLFSECPLFWKAVCRSWMRNGRSISILSVGDYLNKYRMS